MIDSRDRIWDFLERSWNRDDFLDGLCKSILKKER